ncbi:MAG: hypothetical protein V4717_08460 [Bacteroidota bacterium]
MLLLNAQAALSTLLNLMALPGAIMTSVGGFMWYNGSQLALENRSRYGRMLVMFGLILLLIVTILSLFIFVFSQNKPG